MGKLTKAQRAILERMDAEPGSGDMCPQWIAEGCGHFYDTPWASSKMPGLVKRGLVEKLIPGWYRISPAGRSALSEETGR